MRIAVLGPLEVRSDTGDPVAVPGAKERLILGLLAAEAPDAVSVDRLVESLWNGDRPPTARKSLQIHLVRLRGALEPQRPRGSPGRYVVRRGAGYSLAAAADEVDALRVGELVSRGRALLATGDAAGAERALSAALDLWRGEPYQDWPDAPFAERERRRLAELRAGALTARLEARLALGMHAEVVGEVRGLVGTDPLREDWWRLLVLALYRSGRQGDALSALQRARRVLADELGADPGPQLRDLERAVLAQDPALDAPGPAGPAGPAVPDGRPPAQSEPAGTVCPYKGLAAYQAADADLFHGRGRMASRLVARLVDAPLVAVSGSSGAGKSSLVRAGLLPALARGALPGSEAWTAVVVTPGRSPVDALAVVAGDAPAASPVVLVCDQLEELWAPGVHPGERVAFLDTVLGLLDDGIAVRCIVAIRGDHVGRLAEHAAFAERLASAVVLVPPLSEAELRAVVREPAAAVGLAVEDELVDAVVADVLGRPGALPLLSTALVGTWERRRGDRLTLAGYLEAGGVTGSLTRSAEEAWAALDEDERSVARRLLVRLADTDEGGALVRRPAPLAELDLDGDRGAVRRKVVDVFVARRLLSLDGERLDVAHEALLTGWPRLARWLEDDAAGRAVRRHLTPAAREWQRRGRPDDELYRGARLAAALDWAAAADTELSSTEHEFLEASRARADAELQTAHRRASAEAAARRRTRWLATGLAALLVVALVAAALAVRAQRASERASLAADAGRIASISRTAATLDLTFLLAAQAYRLADTSESRDGLLAALVDHRRTLRVARLSPGFNVAVLTDGGRTFFTGGMPQWRVWAAPFDEPPRTIGVAAEDSSIGAASGSPVDALMAVPEGADGVTRVRLVDATGGTRLLAGGAAVGGELLATSFAPDGGSVRMLVCEPAGDGSAWRLVEADLDGQVWRDTRITGRLPAPPGEVTAHFSDSGDTAVVHVVRSDTVPGTLLDVPSGRTAVLAPPPRDAEGANFLALPSGAVYVWEDGGITLYDVAGAVVQQLDEPGSQVFDVAVAADGTWAASAGDDGALLVWDVSPDDGRWSLREALRGHSGFAISAAIDSSGTRLFTTSTDGTAVLWGLDPDGGFGTVTPGLPDREVVGPPEVVDPGELLVVPTRPSAAGGGLAVTATFLHPVTRKIVAETALGDTLADLVSGGERASVSPDRRWVAVTSGLATTILDARSRQAVEEIVLPPTGYVGLDGQVPPAGVVSGAAWAPDGSHLLLAVQGGLDNAREGWIVVIEPGTWRPVDRVPLDFAPEMLEVSRDGRRLAVADADGSRIVALDADTLEPVAEVGLRGEDRLTDLSFSRDGRLLAGGGDAGGVHLVDTMTWKAREPVQVSESSVLQVEWLAGDPATAVVAGDDGRIALVDTERTVVRAVPAPASPDPRPVAAYVLPDPDDEIATLPGGSQALRYPLDAEAWLAEACVVAGRDLTREEWARYLPGRHWRPTCSDLR